MQMIRRSSDSEGPRVTKLFTPIQICSAIRWSFGGGKLGPLVGFACISGRACGASTPWACLRGKHAQVCKRAIGKASTPNASQETRNQRKPRASLTNARHGPSAHHRPLCPAPLSLATPPWQAFVLADLGDTSPLRARTRRRGSRLAGGTRFEAT